MASIDFIPVEKVPSLGEVGGVGQFTWRPVAKMGWKYKKDLMGYLHTETCIINNIYAQYTYNIYMSSIAVHPTYDIYIYNYIRISYHCEWGQKPPRKHASQGLVHRSNGAAAHHTGTPVARSISTFGCL